MEYVWKPVNVLVERQELYLSTVASFHGPAMSAVTIRWQKLHYRGQQMAVVAEEDGVDHGGQHQGMDRPVDVVIVAHRGRVAITARRRLSGLIS